MRPPASRSTLALLALAAAALFAGCGGEDESAAPAATASDARTEIVDIDGVEPLREQFNADEGKPRLLLVLSPT